MGTIGRHGVEWGFTPDRLREEVTERIFHLMNLIVRLNLAKVISEEKFREVSKSLDDPDSYNSQLAENIIKNEIQRRDHEEEEQNRRKMCSQFPLHYYAKFDAERLRELLSEPDYRKKINIADGYGDTPLVCAVQTNMPDCVDVLLRQGADATLRHAKGFLNDSQRRSPLELAELFEFEAIAELLRNHLGIAKPPMFDTHQPDDRRKQMSPTQLHIRRNQRRSYE